MKHALNRQVTMMLAPASQTNSATRTANLDTINADYATILIPLASAINTNAVGPTIQLSESDDTVVTNFATWSSSGTLTATSIAAAKNVTFHIDCKARKRYVRLSLSTATATNDNVTAAAIAETGLLATLPASTSGMAASTNDVVVVL